MRRIFAYAHARGVVDRVRDISAAPTAMGIAPITWLRADLGFKMRPAAYNRVMNRPDVVLTLPARATRSHIFPWRVQ